MSDDEVHSDEDERSSDEEEEEEEEEDVQEEQKVTEAELTGPIKKRVEAEKQKSAGLDETARELLEQNREERDKMDAEIQELRRRNESRKKQREVEEKRLTAERAAEEARRKAEEENRRRQKEEEEVRKQRDRARKMAEFEKWKNPPKANFVISKRATAEDGDEDAEQKADEKGRKSKERLDEEKRAILKQRIRPLDIDDADAARLADKAKELLGLITRLESEKYDLEKNFKARQMEMMELAERARQANRVGKEGLKRIQVGPENSVDRIQERFAGAPAKVEMYSKYERQKDKRSYDDRMQLFTGPQFLSPPDRIKPCKVIRWNDDGLPVYGDADDDSPSGEYATNSTVDGINA